MGDIWVRDALVENWLQPTYPMADISECDGHTDDRIVLSFHRAWGGPTPNDIVGPNPYTDDDIGVWVKGDEIWVNYTSYGTDGPELQGWDPTAYLYDPGCFAACEDEIARHLCCSLRYREEYLNRRTVQDREPRTPETKLSALLRWFGYDPK